MKSKMKVEAADHDFGDEYVVPFGIMNVKDGTVNISILETKVTYLIGGIRNTVVIDTIVKR